MLTRQQIDILSSLLWAFEKLFLLIINHKGLVYKAFICLLLEMVAAYSYCTFILYFYIVLFWGKERIMMRLKLVKF